MTKLVKIVLITLLIVLVVFAALAEKVFDPDWMCGALDLPLYLRLVSLLGVAILFFYALGYRHKIIYSQRYRRAQEVLAQAESDAERKQRSLENQRKKLEAEYEARQQAHQAQLEQLKADYNEKLVKLKEQNMQLKETVSKLMTVVKNKKNSTVTKD